MKTKKPTSVVGVHETVADQVITQDKLKMLILRTFGAVWWKEWIMCNDATKKRLALRKSQSDAGPFKNISNPEIIHEYVHTWLGYVKWSKVIFVCSVCLAAILAFCIFFLQDLISAHGPTMFIMGYEGSAFWTISGVIQILLASLSWWIDGKKDTYHPGSFALWINSLWDNDREQILKSGVVEYILSRSIYWKENQTKTGFDGGPLTPEDRAWLVDSIDEFGKEIAFQIRLCEYGKSPQANSKQLMQLRNKMEALVNILSGVFCLGNAADWRAGKFDYAQEETFRRSSAATSPSPIN